MLVSFINHPHNANLNQTSSLPAKRGMCLWTRKHIKCMAAPVPQVEAITVMNEGRRLIKDSSLPLLPDRSVKGRGNMCHLRQKEGA